MCGPSSEQAHWDAARLNSLTHRPDECVVIQGHVRVVLVWMSGGRTMDANAYT